MTTPLLPPERLAELATVERRHREAAALALSAGPKLADYVVDWIGGGASPARVWEAVAQALADAEARGAAEAEGRLKLKRLESQLLFLYDQGCCVKLSDGRVATLRGSVGIDQTALALGWTPEKGGNNA